MYRRIGHVSAMTLRNVYYMYIIALLYFGKRCSGAYYKWLNTCIYTDLYISIDSCLKISIGIQS